jgi:uncharacterized protein (DUF1919 family)
MRKVLATYYFGFLDIVGFLIIDRFIENKEFTIFSNDCYGGEIYRRLKIPYRTPFIGVMLMAPCYIKFLQNPLFYIVNDLNFIDSSDYIEMNEFRTRNGNYPLGKIHDIEIHFLHYNNEDDAKEKWDKRKLRINWDRILVKFAMDKDYATPELLQQFSELDFNEKVSFSKVDYPECRINIRVPGYHQNAVVTFRRSLKVFNLCGWLSGKGIKFNSFLDKVIGNLLYLTFQR